MGAILFYLETFTKVNGGHTCTQQKCQWVIPSYQREIPYLPVKDLDFTSAKGKHKALEKALEKSANAGASLHSNGVVANLKLQICRVTRLVVRVTGPTP